MNLGLTFWENILIRLLTECSMERLMLLSSVTLPGDSKAYLGIKMRSQETAGLASSVDEKKKNLISMFNSEIHMLFFILLCLMGRARGKNGHVCNHDPSSFPGHYSRRVTQSSTINISR